MASILEQTHVEDLIPKQQTMVVVDSRDPVPKVFKTLVAHNISSAPVKNSDTQEYYGFIDLVDIIALIVKIVESQENRHSGKTPEPEDFYSLLEQVERFDLTYASTIVDLSKRNQMCPVKGKTTLLEAIRVIVSSGPHRLPILSTGYEIVNILSQSTIVQWLNTNINNIGPIKDKSIRELGLGFKTVVSVDIDDVAVNAFKRMTEHNVSSVAVVDSDNVLLSNVSSKDIKAIEADALFTKLYSTLSEFVNATHRHDKNEGVPAFYLHDTATYGEVVHKLAKLKIHRIYLVDEEKHPIGVISLGDVLKALLQDAETRFLK